MGKVPGGGRETWPALPSCRVAKGLAKNKVSYLVLDYLLSSNTSSKSSIRISLLRSAMGVELWGKQGRGLTSLSVLSWVRRVKH